MNKAMNNALLSVYNDGPQKLCLQVKADLNRRGYLIGGLLSQSGEDYVENNLGVNL
tara:strand:- start:96 stop:263 length:168 start_codon:yes stop_codon:yes gene_type:complete